MDSQNINYKDKQRLNAFLTKTNSNKYDIAVLNTKDLSELWVTTKRQAGATQQEAYQLLEDQLTQWGQKPFWENIRPGAAFTANYGAAALDTTVLAKLAQDLQRGGSMFSKYQIKSYSGQAVVVLQGNPAFRKTLTSSTYLATNTKVFSMVMGKVGAAKAIAGGLGISLFLSAGLRGMDMFMRDQATWHYFVGSVAADVVKAAVAGVAGFLAGALTATIGATATVGAFAIGPLFAAVAFGAFITFRLELRDEETGFTKAIILSFKQAEENLQSRVYALEREWSWYHRNPEATVDFWMRVVGARF